MNPHDIYLEWIHLVHNGATEAEFNLLSEGELRQLRRYESRHIQEAKIEIKNGKTIIRKLPTNEQLQKNL